MNSDPSTSGIQTNTGEVENQTVLQKDMPSSPPVDDCCNLQHSKAKPSEAKTENSDSIDKRTNAANSTCSVSEGGSVLQALICAASPPRQMCKERCATLPRPELDRQEDSDDEFRVKIKIVKTYGKQRPLPETPPVSAHSPEQGFPIDYSFSDNSPSSSRPSHGRLNASNDVSSAVYFDSTRYECGIGKDTAINCPSSINGLIVKGFEVIQDDYSDGLLGSSIHQASRHDNCDVIHISPQSLRYTDLDGKDQTKRNYEDISDNEQNKKKKGRKRPSAATASNWPEVCPQASRATTQSNQMGYDQNYYHHADTFVNPNLANADYMHTYENLSIRDGSNHPMHQQNEYYSSHMGYQSSTDPTAAGDCPTYHNAPVTACPSQYNAGASVPATRSDATVPTSRKSNFDKPYPELNRAISCLASEIGGPSYAMEFSNLNHHPANYYEYGMPQPDFPFDTHHEYQWYAGNNSYPYGDSWHSQPLNYHPHHRNMQGCMRYAPYPMMATSHLSQTHAIKHPMMTYYCGSSPYVLGGPTCYSQRMHYGGWSGYPMSNAHTDHHYLNHGAYGTMQSGIPQSSAHLETARTYEEPQRKPESYIVTYTTSPESSRSRSSNVEIIKSIYKPTTEEITPVPSTTEITPVSSTSPEQKQVLPREAFIDPEMEIKQAEEECNARSEEIVPVPPPAHQNVPVIPPVDVDDIILPVKMNPEVILSDVAVQSTTTASVSQTQSTCSVSVQTSFISYPDDVVVEQARSEHHPENDTLTDSDSECECYLPLLLPASDDMVLSLKTSHQSFIYLTLFELSLCSVYALLSFAIYICFAKRGIYVPIHLF